MWLDDQAWEGFLATSQGVLATRVLALGRDCLCPQRAEQLRLQKGVGSAARSLPLWSVGSPGQLQTDHEEITHALEKYYAVRAQQTASDRSVEPPPPPRLGE